jgi:hypothetical protein
MGAPSPGNGSDLDQMLPALERAVERGELVAVVPARTRSSAPPTTGSQKIEAAPQPSDKPKSVVKKTWVSIQLIDDQKKPLAGAAFEIGNGDTVIKSGTLDEHGSAYLDGIPDGKYEVRFPELDGREWR